ncbi:MAG: RNA-binding S4 domain-containing protein [Brumimicrobium sp.]
MISIKFKLQGEYIELIQLLKATSIAQTGGHAKMIVEEGLVVREGKSETRKRAKIRRGEIIKINDEFEIIVL